MGSAEFINIDLQTERILKQLDGSGEDVIAAFFESLKRIHSFKNLDDLRRDHGLRWEKLEGKYLPGTKTPLYSYRITRNWRAICVLNQGPVVEIVVVTDHDSAY